MAAHSRGGVAGSAASGRAHLADARWDAAREAFTAALADEETAEGWEGLSWAAWWLDDADTVFAARERAFALFRARGDPLGAARMATWLAADHLDFRGAAAVAGGWLRRAARLLEDLEPSPEHGWLAFHEGYLAHLAGDTEATARLGARAADLGQRLGVPDLEMLGLALQGATAVACADVRDGMRQLDEARTMAGEAEIPISGAWAGCFFVSACTALLDLERAAEWCEAIEDFAQRFGSRYMLAFCRAEYGTIHLWQGRWEEAGTMLEAAVEDFSLSRPAMIGAPLVALAELRRRQARTDEAGRLLDRTAPSVESLLCRARLALDAGDARRSVELVERALRQAPAERRLDRAPAFALLVRAHIADADLDAARAALRSLEEVERFVGTEPLCAARELAEGLIEAAAGAHERARPPLEDALDRFRRCGMPYEAAQAQLELARSLAALGRVEAAEEEAASARQRLAAMGAGTGSAGGREPRRGPTPREQEVLALLAEGLTNRQIAERLVVSEHTVHRHVTNLLRKLDLPSRSAAAAHAVRSGVAGTAPP